MFGTFFDKVTGLFDRRFVLGLLLPTFALFAGAGALVATDLRWTRTISWWQHLGASRQVALAIAAAAGLVFAATVLGTQVVTITRVNPRLRGLLAFGMGRQDRRCGGAEVAAPPADEAGQGYIGRGLPA